MIRIVDKNIKEEIAKIHQRTSFTNSKEATIVKDILKKIQEKGDSALLEYTAKFDFSFTSIQDIIVSVEEMKNAYENLSEQLKVLLKKAVCNIRNYHEKFCFQGWSEKIYKDSFYGMKVTPIERVGVYIPGGSAALSTTVLMNIIPAQVAGVKDIVAVSPVSSKDGKIDDTVLGALFILGIKEVYAVGGAQAIGALAYGTSTIKKVHKIVGPGNIFVTLAKKEVFGTVGIDKLAGPSDVCVVAGKKAKAAFIAADMLAQAEHDVLSSAILITDSLILAKKVKNQIEEQYLDLDRKKTLDKSLDDNSLIIVMENATKQELAEVVNFLAPEHLELMHEDNEQLLKIIDNAGAIFVGEYSAEVLGDYMLGPNHVLPTGGTAKFSSSLSAIDFQKYSTVVNVSKKDFQLLAEDTAKFAEIEKLLGHANASRIRKTNKKLY
jgi:histidinol dehydrogenase